MHLATADMTLDSGRTGPRAAGSLASGAGTMLASRLVASTLSWIGTLIVIRSLSKAEYGSFTFVFALLGLLGLLADFETSRVVLTEMGRGGDVQALAGRFLVFRIALGTLGYALSMTIVVLGPYKPVEVAGVAIGGLSFFVASALWALISVCQARLWLRVVAVAIVAGQVVQLALIVALRTTGTGTLLRYVWPFVVSDLVSLIVVALALRRAVPLRPRVDTTAWRRWVKQAAPLAIGSALGTLYFKLDSIMLTLLLDGNVARRALATYQVGYKFSDLLAFVAPALIASTLPLLSSAWPARPDEYRRLFRQSLVLVVVIGALATAAFAALASHVIPLLFTDGYASASGPARWLVAGQALNFATQLCYVGLVAAGRARVYPFVTLTGLLVNVALNVALVPAHREMGAAVATVLTEVVVLALLVRALRGLPLHPLPGRAFAVAGVAAIAAAATMVGVTRLVAWPVGALAGVAVYVLLLHALQVDGAGGLKALVENSRIRAS